MKKVKFQNPRNYIKKIASYTLATTMMMTAFVGLGSWNNHVKAAAWRDDSANAVDNLNDRKYPGFKDKIKALQKEYGWTFTIFYTGLDWEEVIVQEQANPHGKNLTQKTGSWVCSSCKDHIYETGNWKCASEMAIAHYMDPRNFIDTDSIFQFETLSYNADIHTEAGVEAILDGTAMSHSRICDFYDGKYGLATFAQVIMWAAEKNGVSPYYMASRVRLETGGGTSGSATGDNATYPGYFNYFNIGAGSGSNVVENALAYAYEHGWDNPWAAMDGGASFIAKGYISRGQDTTYLQKYNVTEKNTYFHQYQGNIQAANNESWTTSKAYKQMGIFHTPMNFVIPVYENMPGSDYGIKPIGTAKLDGDYIYVTPDTNVAAVEQLLNKDVKAIRKDGKGLNKEDLVGTETEIDWKYTIIKRGDVDGNGKATAADYMKIKNYITDGVKIGTDNQIKAADVDKNNKISAADYMKIKNYITDGIKIEL